LLYFADRECLIRYGHPICGGVYKSMPHGPVLSELYNVITEDLWTETSGYWEDHFRNVGQRDIELIKPAEPGHLSTAQVEILEQVFEQFRTKSDGEIYNLGHDLPEYEDPGKSSRPIPVKRILALAGKSADRIKEVAEDAANLELADKIFGK